MPAQVTADLRSRGHPAAQAVVQRAIRSERPPHALLLVGPARVGKTTLAIDLAAGLLCLADDPADRPCRGCAACRKVDHGNHPDVHRLAPAGAGQQIRLAQVQALGAALALMPAEGRFRVAIIEAAQRLNPDAQNALLKTLEEPHPRVVLILAADEPADLLPTVVSRCARLRLGAVDSEEVAALIAAAGAADAARGARLARLAGGRPGLALAMAARPEVIVVQERLCRRLLALLDAGRRERLAAVGELLEDAAELVAAGDPPSPVELPARRKGGAASARPAPAERRLAAAQLLATWRDLGRDLAVAVSGGLAELRMHELADELTAAAGRVDRASVAGALARLDRAGRAVDGYANPELLLDVMLLAWPRARAAA